MGERVLGLRALVPGEASGALLILTAPLSFWGGVDLDSAKIVDPVHPQAGACLTDTLLVLPGLKGSTAGPGALLELLVAGKGPKSLLSFAPEPALVIAARLAAEVTGRTTPVAVVLEPEALAAEGPKLAASARIVVDRLFL